MPADVLCGDVSATLFRTHAPHGAARYDGAGTLHAWQRRQGQDVWSVVACDGPDLGTSFGAAQVADTVFVGGGNGRDSGTLWRLDSSKAGEGSPAGWQSCGQLWEDAGAAAEATVRLVDGCLGSLLICAGPACAVVEHRCGADRCAGRLRTGLQRPRDDGGRTGFSAVSFGGGDVVAFGGRDAFGAVRRDVFRWTDGRWTEEYCGGSVPEPRVDHCADTLPKGDVMVVVGGFDQGGGALVSAHTLCLLSRTWRTLALAPAVSAQLPATSLLFTRSKPCGLLLAGMHGGVAFTPSAKGRAAKAKPPSVRPRPPPTTAAAAPVAATAEESAAAARVPRPVFSVRTAKAGTARVFSTPQLCADAVAHAPDTQLSAADRERVVARLAVRREGGGYAGATEAEYRALMPESGTAELPPRLTREEERWQVERLFAHEAGARRLKAQLLMAKWRPSTPRSVLPQDTIDAVVRNLTPGPSCVRPRPPKVTAPLDGRARRLVRRLHTADVAQRKRRQGECVERCYYNWDAYWDGEAWQPLGEYALPTRNRGRGC